MDSGNRLDPLPFLSSPEISRIPSECSFTSISQPPVSLRVSVLATIGELMDDGLLSHAETAELIRRAMNGQEIALFDLMKSRKTPEGRVLFLRMFLIPTTPRDSVESGYWSESPPVPRLRKPKPVRGWRRQVSAGSTHKSSPTESLRSTIPGSPRNGRTPVDDSPVVIGNGNVFFPN